LSLGLLPRVFLKTHGGSPTRVVVQRGAGETRVTIVGLTAQEAEARLDQVGPHEPAATQQRSFLSISSMSSRIRWY
jgi:hypothetical protein